MPFDENGDEYDEYKLYSNGKGLFEIPHHIMKISSGSKNISLESLVEPLVMFRAKQVLDAAQLEAMSKSESESQQVQGKSKNGPFKKKSKQYFLGREAEDVVLGGEDQEKVVGALIAPITSRFGDPDKLPWQLKDADGQVLTGTLEGSQSSSHVLFLSHSDGFKVISVSKWYLFKPRPNRRTLTLEEAEEKMKNQKKINDRWLMRAEAAEAAEKSGLGAVKKEKPIKAWRQKLMGIDPDAKNDTTTILSSSKKSAMPKDDEDIEEIGIDFEEGFSDDEDINFGMDDQDEAKEAKKRIFQKGVAGYDDDVGLWKDSTAARQIAKSLVKRENQDVYTDIGPENPYWSDEEDEDEETEKEAKGGEQVNAELEKAKRAKLQIRSGATSPAASAFSASPAPELPSLKLKMTASIQPAAKRRKLHADDESASRSASVSRQGSQSPPPPPSAVQVIKKLERAQKRKGSRGPSASPAPTSGLGTSTAGASPLSLEYVPGDPNELTAKVLIDLIKSKDKISVREVAGSLKSYLTSKKENVGKLKELMKAYCVHDKKSGLVTLKKPPQ